MRNHYSYSSRSKYKCAWRIYDVTFSRNYGKVKGCRHAFRLLNSENKIWYRGYAIFPDDAQPAAILRPLFEFGIAHGCSSIAYKVKKHYKKAPTAALFHLDQITMNLPGCSVVEFLSLYDLRNLSEAEEDQIEKYIAFVTRP